MGSRSGVEYLGIISVSFASNLNFKHTIYPDDERFPQVHCQIMQDLLCLLKSKYIITIHIFEL